MKYLLGKLSFHIPRKNVKCLVYLMNNRSIKNFHLIDINEMIDVLPWAILAATAHTRMSIIQHQWFRPPLINWHDKWIHFSYKRYKTFVKLFVSISCLQLETSKIHQLRRFTKHILNNSGKTIFYGFKPAQILLSIRVISK